MVTSLVQIHQVRISKEELEDFWDNMFEDMVRNEKVTDKTIIK